MINEPWVCGPCLAGDCAGCDIAQAQAAEGGRRVVVCACPRCGPMWPTGVLADRAGSPEIPSAQTLRDFADRLAAFRKTLPLDQQRLLDALLLAALRPDWQEDFESYWMTASGGPPWPSPLQPAPTPPDLQAFGEQLVAFRETLLTARQALFDTMIAVALRPSPRAGVTAFWAADTPVRPGSNDAWYRGDSAVQWATTFWGRAWRNA